MRLARTGIQTLTERFEKVTIFVNVCADLKRVFAKTLLLLSSSC